MFDIEDNTSGKMNSSGEDEIDTLGARLGIECLGDNAKGDEGLDVWQTHRNFLTSIDSSDFEARDSSSVLRDS